MGGWDGLGSLRWVRRGWDGFGKVGMGTKGLGWVRGGWDGLGGVEVGWRVEMGWGRLDG